MSKDKNEVPKPRPHFQLKREPLKKDLWSVAGQHLLASVGITVQIVWAQLLVGLVLHRGKQMKIPIFITFGDSSQILRSVSKHLCRGLGGQGGTVGTCSNIWPNGSSIIQPCITNPMINTRLWIRISSMGVLLRFLSLTTTIRAVTRIVSFSRSSRPASSSSRWLWEIGKMWNVKGAWWIRIRVLCSVNFTFVDTFVSTLIILDFLPYPILSLINLISFLYIKSLLNFSIYSFSSLSFFRNLGFSHSDIFSFWKSIIYLSKFLMSSL